MKKCLNLLLLLICYSFNFCNAQNYIVLKTDHPADVVFPGQPSDPDLKQVSYLISNDSIYFKIETFNQIGTSSSFGLVIAIDTNLNLSDGKKWTGSNAGMKYDHALFIMSDPANPGKYNTEIGDTGSHHTVDVKITRPDNTTFIVGIKMSVIDQNNSFNLLVGSSTWNAVNSVPIIFDEIPDAGFGHLSIQPTAIKNINANFSLSLYPNPANKYLSISGLEPNTHLQITAIDEKIVFDQYTQHQQVNIQIGDLPSGMYILTAQSASTLNKIKFMKK